jgi:hypothetical protein
VGRASVAISRLFSFATKTPSFLGVFAFLYFPSIIFSLVNYTRSHEYDTSASCNKPRQGGSQEADGSH